MCVCVCVCVCACVCVCVCVSALSLLVCMQNFMCMYVCEYRFPQMKFLGDVLILMSLCVSTYSEHLPIHHNLCTKYKILINSRLSLCLWITMVLGNCGGKRSGG